jgi:hypothetical protein
VAERLPGYVLHVVGAPASADGIVRVQSADGACVYEVRWDANRLTRVAVISDVEGCDVALLHERITPNARAVVADRPGLAPCTVFRRRIPGKGPGLALVARDERTVIVSEGAAARGHTFVQDGQAIARSTRRRVPGEACRLQVNRREDAPLVLAVLMGLEVLRAGSRMLAGPALNLPNA